MSRMCRVADHGNILIAIGANLPTPGGSAPLLTCQNAAARLNTMPGMRLAAISRWWLSAPVPPSCQPDYVNGVARLAGHVAPEALLEALKELERKAGRVAGERNAARQLDLDIIAIGNLIRKAADPILPHPRAHLRAFVLAPLAEVFPGWVHPVLGCTVEAMLAELQGQQVRPLDDASCALREQAWGEFAFGGKSPKGDSPCGG